MLNRSTSKLLSGLLAAQALGCGTALAQETALETITVPASIRPLPADVPAAGEVRRAEAERAERAPVPTAAAGAEEVVVRGRSPAFLRQRLEMAQDKMFEVFNEINTIDEFDFTCRQHAQTGTRIPQRTCVPQFVDTLEERQAQALVRVFTGGAYDLDWQTPNAQIFDKARLLEDHMRDLAMEHPELRDAMLEVYELSESLYPNRTRRMADQLEAEAERTGD